MAPFGLKPTFLMAVPNSTSSSSSSVKRKTRFWCHVHIPARDPVNPTLAPCHIRGGTMITLNCPFPYTSIEYSKNAKHAGKQLYFEGIGGWMELKQVQVPNSIQKIKVSVTYSSADSRPLTFYVNGDKVPGIKLCEQITGSYSPPGQTHISKEIISLPEGTQNWKLHSSGFWPHVYKISFLLCFEDANGISDLKENAVQKPLWDQKLLLADIQASQERKKQFCIRQACQVVCDPFACHENASRQGSMWFVNGTKGWMEFEVLKIGDENKFSFLGVQYACDGSRPLKLIINGNREEKEICHESTGGFDSSSLQWKRFGPFQFVSGINFVRVETNGYFPHVGGIRIEEEDEMPLSQELDWIVPPSFTFKDKKQIPDSICSFSKTQEPSLKFEPDQSFYNAINLDGLWILASKKCRSGTLERCAAFIASFVPIEIRKLCSEWRAPVGRPLGPMRLVILDPHTNEQAGDCPDMPSDWTGRNGTSNPCSFTSADDLYDKGGSLTCHELMHALDMVIRQQIDPYFHMELESLYQDALASGVYKDSYAASGGKHEYIAECLTVFLNCPSWIFRHHKVENMRCKSDLIMNDFPMYCFLKKYFMEPPGDDHWSVWLNLGPLEFFHE